MHRQTLEKLYKKSKAVELISVILYFVLYLFSHFYKGTLPLSDRIIHSFSMVLTGIFLCSGVVCLIAGAKAKNKAHTE